MDAIGLGPFDLVAPIARGGMGEVWRGRHRAQGVPVAVKVMTARATREARYVTGFRNEVRHMAGLDHPAIVLVLDQGEIDEAISRAAGGRLAAGSPYLVMELATGGTLAELPHTGSWRTLKAILLSLLDALAHAHARGVVHRDIKPANVLLCTATDARPGLKLTDFGIAHPLDAQPASGEDPVEVAGTLHYMAPEQALGRWRDYGPWTDLYALGGLAYRLASGRVPFHGHKGMALTRAQLLEAPPPIEPRCPVPRGFDAWVERLLQKDPFRRFQRAADAALALLDLGDPASDAEAPGEAALNATLERHAPILVPQPSTLYADPLLEDLPEIAADDLVLVATGGPAAPRPTEGDSRALPASWRRPLPAPPPLNLVGAGLGLYGLRTPPFVDRETERDALWEALREVQATRTARCVVVHGGAGTGKSRLVGWIAERAHELGAATVLQAIGGRHQLPVDAVTRMVIRFLRTQHLWRLDVEARVEALLEAHGGYGRQEVAALAELVCPATERDRRAGIRTVRLGSAAERHAVVRRLLGRLGRERPVVLWLEDAHFSADALDLALGLLGSQAAEPLPVLVVVTATDEVLVERAVEASRVGDLRRRPDTRTVALGPLRAVDQTRLVRDVLGLEAGLATRIEERAAGNPLFALQLVGELVHRGVLALGPTGFELASDREPDLPDDLHAAWSARVGQVSAGLPDHARACLELAAVLGREVDAPEWAFACDRGCGGPGASVEIRSVLLERLLAARLVIPGDRGWSWANEMLRESLERSAREAGRLADHHRTCAALVERAIADGLPGLSERLGRHLLGAGATASAIDPLLEGVWHRRQTSSYRSALSLLDRAEQAMRDAALPASDARWGQAGLLRAGLHRMLGTLDEAIRHADRTIAAARAHGWLALAHQATNEKAQALLMRYDLDGCAALLWDLVAELGPDGDASARGRALYGLGNVATQRREFADAIALLDEAEACFARSGEAHWAADCTRAVAAAHLAAGDLATARQLVERALQAYEAMGLRFGEAECWNGIAEIDRLEGRLGDAEEGYRRAADAFAGVGSGQEVVPRLNLGFVRLQAGEHAQARAAFELVLRTLAEQERPQLIGATHASLLPCAAHAEDWGAFDLHLAEARAGLERTGFADPDVAEALDLAARLARPRDPARAEAADALAKAQWRILGRSNAAAATP